jgi:hypothetical protein
VDDNETMESAWNEIVWRQFGATIDMLENAIRVCPEQVWSDRSRKPEFWYVAFHTLFFLDYYLTGSPHGFAPPAPFNLDELDPAGIIPEQPYTRDQLLRYLDHGRKKCRAAVGALTDSAAAERCGFEQRDVTRGELLLYNLRHVQHHAAQLNLILRHAGVEPPRWVTKARESDQ